jgi:hypothetical protein
MDISRCFKQHNNVFYCSHCYHYYVLSLEQIIQLKKLHSFHKYNDSITPFQEVCMLCCEGVMIPFSFFDSNGNFVENFNVTGIKKDIKHKIRVPNDKIILSSIILFQNNELDPFTDRFKKHFLLIFSENIHYIIAKLRSIFHC